MNRRGFLKGLTAVVGGIALEEAIPLGRVWSFPKEIVIPKYWPQMFVATSVGKLLGIFPALPSGAFSVDHRVANIAYGASQPFRLGDIITIHGIHAKHPVTNRPIPINEAARRAQEFWLASHEAGLFRIGDVVTPSPS